MFGRNFGIAKKEEWSNCIPFDEGQRSASEKYHDHQWNLSNLRWQLRNEFGTIAIIFSLEGKPPKYEE